jgi:hypothetical protein
VNWELDGGNRVAALGGLAMPCALQGCCALSQSGETTPTGRGLNRSSSITLYRKRVALVTLHHPTSVLPPQLRRSVPPHNGSTNHRSTVQQAGLETEALVMADKGMYPMIVAARVLPRTLGRCTRNPDFTGEQRIECQMRTGPKRTHTIGVVVRIPKPNVAGATCSNFITHVHIRIQSAV